MPINERLTELRTELEKGQQEITRLERRRQDIHATMLRISGAIQVLEELSTKEGSPPAVEATGAIPVAA